VPDIMDAIADLTETGSSLHRDGLRILDTVLTSHTEPTSGGKVRYPSLGPTLIAPPATPSSTQGRPMMAPQRAPHTPLAQGPRLAKCAEAELIHCDSSGARYRRGPGRPGRRHAARVGWRAAEFAVPGLLLRDTPAFTGRDDQLARLASPGGRRLPPGVAEGRAGRGGPAHQPG
jgi:hypothetical protein